MKHKLFISILFVALILPIAGCAGLESAGHKYLMRGQVLESTGDTVHICIGSNDGAQAGQELTAYKIERRPGPHKNAVSFQREKTGTIKIIQVVDEHFATARVTSGEVKENFVVELNP